MSGKLRTSPDRRQIILSPFDVHWGTDVPSAGIGVNGDIYIRYGSTAETFYKKVSGAWQLAGGGGSFQGFDSSNSELFELTSNTSSTTIGNFTLAADSKIVVKKDGIEIYEGYGYTRNVGTNSIDFDETILADTSSKVLVFAGLYS